MNIVISGVNHKTAPIELREQLVISSPDLAEANRALTGIRGVEEGLVLSTCNRVELITAQGAGAPPSLECFEQFFHVESGSLRGHVYEHRDREAIRHLFRVASSLDSMVVGEPQILGQVKDAYLTARMAGTVEANLNRLLQRTLTVARRVRRETRIGGASVSVASVAVDLAQKIFGSLEDKKVLLVGAGKMSELAARRLVQCGAGTVLVANRTASRAEDLARELNGAPLRFEDIERTADQADIVITSTGAPRAIFLEEHVKRFLERRSGRPMFFIDIAVPRDVDPAVNKLEGAFLYDIDDLESVALANMAERTKAAEEAEALIEREVEEFEQRLQALNVVPEILRLEQLAEGIRQAELRRVEARLGHLTPEQRSAVDALTESLMGKFLHHPLEAIKEAAREGDLRAVEVIRKAFGLHLTGRYGVPGEDFVHPGTENYAAKESEIEALDAVLTDGSPGGRPER